MAVPPPRQIPAEPVPNFTSENWSATMGGTLSQFLTTAQRRVQDWVTKATASLTAHQMQQQDVQPVADGTTSVFTFSTMIAVAADGTPQASLVNADGTIRRYTPTDPPEAGRWTLRTPDSTTQQIVLDAAPAANQTPFFSWWIARTP